MAQQSTKVEFASQRIRISDVFRRNIGSSLLSDSENDKIFTVMGSSCRVFAAGLVELLEGDRKLMEWRKIADGAVCYVHDFYENVTFLSLVEAGPNSRSASQKWTVTLNSTMVFEKITANFIALHASEEKIYGMNFCVSTEASEFFRMLLTLQTYPSDFDWKYPSLDTLDESSDEQSNFGFQNGSIEAERSRRVQTARTRAVTAIEKLKQIFAQRCLLNPKNLLLQLAELLFRACLVSAGRQRATHRNAKPTSSRHDDAKSVEIRGPINFEHKIHIGLDSVHCCDANDNGELNRVLGETQLVFAKHIRRTNELTAVEDIQSPERESSCRTTVKRSCSLKDAKDSIRLRSREQSRTTLTIVKHFDQAKKNSRKLNSYKRSLEPAQQQRISSISGTSCCSLPLLNDIRSEENPDFETEKNLHCENQMQQNNEQLCRTSCSNKSESQRPKTSAVNIQETFVEKIQQRRQWMMEESSCEESVNSGDEW